VRSAGDDIEDFAAAYSAKLAWHESEVDDHMKDTGCRIQSARKPKGGGGNPRRKESGPIIPTESRDRIFGCIREARQGRLRKSIEGQMAGLWSWPT
jgi:hypothetical protein